MICTAITHALTRLFNSSGSSRHKVGHLHVQFRNCVGQNKNDFVLAFLSILVVLEIVETIEVHFMMVGHTHIKIDQFFSR